MTLRYKTETDLLGFTGGFTRDNTLMGELLTTGVVLRFTQRNQWTANPSWTRSITEKLSFQSSFQLNDTTYENGLSLGLVDYQLSRWVRRAALSIDRTGSNPIVRLIR